MESGFSLKGLIREPLGPRTPNMVAKSGEYTLPRLTPTGEYVTLRPTDDTLTPNRFLASCTTLELNPFEVSFGIRNSTKDGQQVPSTSALPTPFFTPTPGVRGLGLPETGENPYFAGYASSNSNRIGPISLPRPAFGAAGGLADAILRSSPSTEAPNPFDASRTVPSEVPASRDNRKEKEIERESKCENLSGTSTPASKRSSSSLDLDEMSTDENGNKRARYLQRNRMAAMKCRQKKKQWMEAMTRKVEQLTSQNVTLERQATVLKDEILRLRYCVQSYQLAAAKGQLMPGMARF